VKPPPFEYHAPESLPEALDLLATLGDEAKVLAGGQSLVPLLNLRLARPAHLVDINNLHELTEIGTLNGGLRVGALVRQRAAERSELVHQYCPLMAEAVPMIGHPQIRNRGTMGGSLAHADPASELPAVVAALDGELVVRSAKGERTVKPADFFVSYLTTSLAADELLVELRLPAWTSGTGWAFMEISRRHGDFAMVGVASTVRLAPDQSIAEARLAYTGAGSAPVRAHDAERQLVGQPAAEATFVAASEEAIKDLDPPSDIHATAAYRRHITKTLTRRALALATTRAGASTNGSGGNA
jgi:carbon-monoxide dehydrogenase medium subunit